MEIPFHVDFRGKVAVVTGGSGVLCREFCRALSKCGAKVAVIGRNLNKAESVALEIVAEGGEAAGFSADVTDRTSVEAVYAAVLEHFGKCDILINGAGGNDSAATTDDEFFSADILNDQAKKSFFDLEPEGFSSVFDKNMMAVLLPTRAFGRDMAKRKSGVILNISSMNAFTPLTKIPAYSAAKAAVSNFTQWLAVYLSKSGIRVNAIAPGFISTEQNKTLLWNPDNTPTARAEKILKNTPMGRFGEPKELLGTLLWLLDENSSGFVTGIVVPVDGGFSAYSGV